MLRATIKWIILEKVSGTVKIFSSASNAVPTSRFLFPRGDDMPSCKTDQGEWGVCVDVRLCYAARRAINAGNHPIRCGWINNFVPKVCCHPDQVQHPKMIFRPNRNNRSQRRRDYY
ncbi:hypothetical protein AVEN_121246-1 [Araneus ventricosus]|uniref:Clip domain-containing protein n=1 Tax=Araneus ventricosus TaxID=182803 RepID=A0A4Y2P7U4_ARAVE|nr:hypothetical protein AVEN_121246-1 [Araneus ventricosus]